MNLESSLRIAQAHIRGTSAIFRVVGSWSVTPRSERGCHSRTALNSTCHVLQRWEPGMKALKKSTNNVRPGDSPLLTSFHEEEIGWIGYYTPGQMAMRRASGQMAKFSFAWNLLIAPSVLLIANKFTWERYLALASPGLVALGVAIPLNIKGHSSKMLTLNLPPEACDPECAGQIIANTP
jgi:hypothetical protein